VIGDWNPPQPELNTFASAPMFEFPSLTLDSTLTRTYDDSILHLPTTGAQEEISLTSAALQPFRSDTRPSQGSNLPPIPLPAQCLPKGPKVPRLPFSPKPKTENLLHYAGILAVLLSQRRRGLPLALNTNAAEARSGVELLPLIVDLFAWLQIEPAVITLSLSYFIYQDIRLDQPESGCWTEFLVCLKFALVFHTDGTLSVAYPWSKILAWCAPEEAFNRFCSLEGLLLMNLRFHTFTSAEQYAGMEVHLKRCATQYLQPGRATNTQSDVSDLAPPPYNDSKPEVVLKVSWEHHKDRICELYQFHTLEEVAAIMAREHGFRASIRSFRQRLASWGAKKRDMEGSASSTRRAGTRPLEVLEWSAQKQPQ